MTLVDTSSWIHALRHNGNADVKQCVGALLREGEACWCDMVRVELFQGAAKKKELDYLQELDRDLVLLPTTREVWEHVCAISRTLRMAGKMVPFTDRLIFSCSRIHATGLEHRDRHFDTIAETVSEGGD